ncbi:hypothetical protein COO60DRAFT_1126344 [Scenedesmus sp. NREL 46B-D3]|nr:hypothetical protein COO60DRAFT_1126344 [Scenedesmus sp. NREL 46B-D3]
MQLQQRLVSSSKASCSYAARPFVAHSRRSTAPAAAHKHPKQSTKPSLQLCRVAELDEVDEEGELEQDPSQTDNPYDRMVDINNVYPDYEDEEWVSRVTNWEEFWYESEDILDMEDEDAFAADQSMQAINRAYSLIQQLGSLRKRTDVEQMIGPRVRPPETYDQSYTNAFQYADEMPMERIDPNPDWNVMDMRALAEKRRHRALFDAEWRHQTSLLARPSSFTLQQRHPRDARLQGSDKDWIREGETWTHEQIMDLIVGGGKFVHPDKVKVAVMNPLLPADFHGSGVHAVPETEDFIASIGHLATENEILHLQSEVELSEKDFVDPTLVFEDREGNLYTEAPVNRWAQLAKARDAADIELFEAVVDRMNARQAKRDAAAAATAAGQEDVSADDAALLSLEGGSGAAAAALAAAAEGWDGDSDEDEEYEDEEVLDEMYGEGFTEFMQGQDGVVFYADGEEGEEAENEQEEGEQLQR